LRFARGIHAEKRVPAGASRNIPAGASRNIDVAALKEKVHPVQAYVIEKEEAFAQVHQGNANTPAANMPFVSVPKSFAGPAFCAKVRSSWMSLFRPHGGHK
jgi:hypothetical protein